MSLVKRIFLYLLTNLLIVVTISLVTSALGLHGYLTRHGIDYSALAALCLVWGMSASLIALALSRIMAKLMMGVELIDPTTSPLEQRQLMQKVYHLARRAGLHTMPQVGIYDAPDVNAFATGPTKSRSLVAVSSSLLNKMNEDEIEGVLAHEISHISNGDMVTMTLLQGVVNAFSLFLSRIMAYSLRVMLSRHSDRHGHARSTVLYVVLTMAFDLLLTLLGSLIVAAFSRYREYRADKGGAHLAGRQKMIAALECLRNVMMPTSEEESVSAIAPLQINRHHRKNRLLALFATHPDINLRIAALR
jgi:heat shock protein HtpX